jgi:hypothetical protein
MVGANVYFSLVAVRTGAPTGLTAGTGAGDVLYALAHPASYVAVVLGVRARVSQFLSSMWWDGLTTGLGLAAVVVSLLPVWRLTTASSAGSVGVPALWYPAADLLLLALLAAGAAVLGAGWDRMMLVAALVVAVGDLIYVMQCAVGSYGEGGLSDGLNLSRVSVRGALAVPRRPPPGGRPLPESGARGERPGGFGVTIGGRPNTPST